jgi:CheY-like chemotaxis protein
MRILLAVSDPGLRAEAVAALEPEGHRLTVLGDALEALAAAQAQPPDLVLAARDLAPIGGLELARLLRLGLRHRFVPVLMFNPGTDPGFLRACLEAGVVEFIAWPFDPAELHLRVKTLNRMLALQSQLLEYQARTGEELALVKHMLERLGGPGQNAPGFHMETLQSPHINGDAWVQLEPLPGVHFGMICDATGHGLMAGVSTLPAVLTFRALAARDLPLPAIYQEIHQQLQSLLPTGRFACLLMLRLDAAHGFLSILNAGMPEVHLLRAGGIIQTEPSQVLPAGIRGVDPGAVATQVDLAPGDRILAFSDGLGDRVSPEQLRSEFLAGPAGLSHPRHCQVIRQRIQALDPAHELADDLTWGLWEVPPAPEPPPPMADDGALVPAFQAEFQMDPRVHGPRTVLPRILAMVLGFPIPHQAAQTYAMLLHEALTNAVEHGLLGLDSAAKAEGFEAFERERQLALARKAPGSVRLVITLLHREDDPAGSIRRIRTVVEDSGPGFDWRAWLGPRDPGLRPFGRGLELIRGLGRDLEFNETGNSIAFSVDCP